MSEHGDILNNTGSFYSEDPDSLPVPTFKYSARPWERLRHFQAECHRRGVRVFLSWPALPTRLGKNESAVRRYLEAIDAHAARLGLFRLGDPGDYRLDQRYFFNTIYHLNDEGRTIRTSRLLVHLQRHL
jgi:hypothetical protein